MVICSINGENDNLKKSVSSFEEEMMKERSKKSSLGAEDLDDNNDERILTIYKENKYLIDEKMMKDSIGPSMNGINKLI